MCTLFFTGCSKKETMGVDNETQSVVDYAIVDQEFISIIAAVYESALNTPGTGAQSTIPTSCNLMEYISGDSLHFNPHLVFEFNPSSQNCSSTMPDGKIRTGKISIRLTGAVKDQNSQMIVKLRNYVADGIQYSCDSIVITTTKSNSTYAAFSVKLSNGACKTSSFTINYSFESRLFDIYPKGDPVGSDAVVYTFGPTLGTNRNGTNFSTNVTQYYHLVKNKTCPYIVKGTMELTPQGFKPRTIDFGDGACDEEATFTVKENTVAFKLK